VSGIGFEVSFLDERTVNLRAVFNLSSLTPENGFDSKKMDDLCAKYLRHPPVCENHVHFFCRSVFAFDDKWLCVLI